MAEKKFISDIISKEDIETRWIPSSRVLITAQTGSGKSEFIKNILYEHCFKTGEKILLLTNRNVLREQVKEDVKEKIEQSEFDILNVINYQSIEYRILNDIDVQHFFDQATYIIYDEAHYLFSDSMFNRNTDLLLDFVKKSPKDKIVIFLTATPQALQDYQKNYDYIYHLPEDYSFIRNLYFYTSEDVVEAILQDIPPDEKAIYFSSNAKNGLKLSQLFSDSSFYCSDDNRFSDFSDKKVFNQIVELSLFKNKYLFTTKVLDNGINIKDSQLKHILIDMADPISFIQCLGRKRLLDDNDYVDVYVKSYHDGNLKYILSGFQNQVAIVEELKNIGKEEFLKKYRKQSFDTVIDNDLKINDAKLQNAHTQIRLINQMLYNQEKDKNLNSYENYICNLLNFDTRKIKNANEDFQKVSLEEIVKKYENQKMFAETREKFKIEFTNKIFSPRRIDLRSIGRKSINALMEENYVNYRIEDPIRNKSRDERRDQTYWIIKKYQWGDSQDEENI